MKVVFIDRDGVINKEVEYLYRVQDFEFVEGVLNSCKYLQNKGFNLIIVTNQSGIGRGYYKEKDFSMLNNWMLSKLSEQGITILDVFYCPHTPEDNCHCRKPKTGLFDKAHKKYRIDKNTSWMIGDKESDIRAANDFGVFNTILVESGHKIDKKNSKATFILRSIQDVNSCII